ncbi:MAG: TlpA family protein disulfide reductase [Bacteroidales bacterium]|nr:TlpA family protein disulfide reductase [Bacteroidales bacterium]
MKRFFYAFVVLLLAAACGQDKFVVKGTVAEGETFPENALVCLYDGDNLLDSCAVVDGAFTLKGPANPEKLYRISAKYDRPQRDRSWNFGVIPEKGTFPVTFAQNALDCTIDSQVNRDFLDFNLKMQDIAKEYRDRFMALEDKSEEAVDALMDDINGKMKALSLDAIGKNANNYIAKNALQNIIYDLPLDELKEIIGKCGKFVGEDEGISRIVRSKEAELETAEGKPFVDFAGKTPEGADIKLSDYVGKGKWVLTDFWASWCGPCMGEIPNIKKVFETFEGDDFMVLGVAVWERDGDNTASAKKMEEKEMKWHQIFVGDDKTPTDSYGIVGIPTMILFAPDGTIYKRGEVLRGESMYKTVAEALGK